MDASQHMNTLPVHTTSNLAAKYFVRHSSTSPKQQRRPLPSLLSSSSSIGLSNSIFQGVKQKYEIDSHGSVTNESAMQYSKDYLITIKKRLEFIFGQQHNCTGQNSTQENETDQYYDSRHFLWKIAIKQPLLELSPMINN